MQRVIEEMAKAKGDIEKRYREKLPEIIRECMAFAYLGKSFTFDANADLEEKVNRKLIALSDEIMEDIQARAKRCIAYAEEEDDEEAILAYMKREQNGEDLITRIDKHNSNLRYFLEGWIAIGMVNGLSNSQLLTNIFTYMHDAYLSKLWIDAYNQGYRSNAIRTRGYHFGQGILKNPITALTELERNSINEAFQYGRVLRYGKDGAIGYRTHRASGFPCDHCDELTLQIWPLDLVVLPAHPRCVCYSTPIYAGEEIDGFVVNDLALYRKNLLEYDKLKSDPNYREVYQGKINAAVSAIHNKHKIRTGAKEKRYFDEQLTSSELELWCQRESIRMGHSFILADEGRLKAHGQQATSLDAFADWVRADIKSITSNNRYTITNAIRDKSDQLKAFNSSFPEEKTDALILYFHEPERFNKEHVIWSWGNANSINGKPRANYVRRIICVVKGYDDWVELKLSLIHI